MNIDKTNYEIFFLDYHEGNLPAEQVAELFLFLEENPQLKQEFESFESISLTGKTVLFPDKALLKKGFIDESNYSRFFVGHVEGTLDADEKRMLAEFLVKFPAYHTELELFEKTILQPDWSVVFPDKRELKKPVPLFSQGQPWYYVAAAACILFLLGAFLLFQYKSNGPNIAERPVTPVGTPAPAPSTSPAPIHDVQKNMASQNEEKKGSDDKTPGSIEQKNAADHLNVNHQKQMAHQMNKQIKNKNSNSSKQAVEELMVKEEIALLIPVEPKLTVKEQEVALAGISNEATPAGYHTLTASSSLSPSFPSVGQLIQQYSTNRLTETINDKPLSDELLNKRVSGKVKGVKFMGWCLGKVTGKKVDVKTVYNPDGKLTAYRISAGRFQFGKTFASR